MSDEPYNSDESYVLAYRESEARVAELETERTLHQQKIKLAWRDRAVAAEAELADRVKLHIEEENRADEAEAEVEKLRKQNQDPDLMRATLLAAERHRVQVLEAERDSLRAQLTQYGFVVEKAKELEAEVESERKDRDAWRTHARNVEDERAEARAELAKRNEEVAAGGDRIVHFKNVAERAEATLEIAQAANAHLLPENQRLEAEVEKLRVTQNDISQAATQYRLRAEKAEAEVERLRAEVHRRRGAVKLLQRAEKAEAKLAEVEKERDEAEQGIEDLQASLKRCAEHATDQHASIERAREKLKKQLKLADQGRDAFAWANETAEVLDEIERLLSGGKA